MVMGMPSSSVKKVCVGVLHKLTHIPTQPLSAKYLQRHKEAAALVYNLIVMCWYGLCYQLDVLYVAHAWHAVCFKMCMTLQFAFCMDSPSQENNKHETCVLQ